MVSGSATAKTSAVAKGAATVAITTSRRPCRAAGDERARLAPEVASSVSGTAGEPAVVRGTGSSPVCHGGAPDDRAGGVGTTGVSTRTRTVRDAEIFICGPSAGDRPRRG